MHVKCSGRGGGFGAKATGETCLAGGGEAGGDPGVAGKTGEWLVVAMAAEAWRWS
jgi:hypothetical protein